MILGGISTLFVLVFTLWGGNDQGDRNRVSIPVDDEENSLRWYLPNNILYRSPSFLLQNTIHLIAVYFLYFNTDNHKPIKVPHFPSSLPPPWVCRSGPKCQVQTWGCSGFYCSARTSPTAWDPSYPRTSSHPTSWRKYPSRCSRTRENDQSLSPSSSRS